MIVIGIHGKKQSGKDECYKAIAHCYSTGGLKVERIAFADALKEEIAKACGVSVEFIENNKVLFRPILQWWGTEFRRGQDELYWIKKYGAKLLASKSAVIVTPDVRFKNEYDLIAEIGGYNWRVIRGAPLKDSDMHSSETDLDEVSNWDATMLNNSTIQSLCQEIEFKLKTNNYAIHSAKH